MIPTANTNSLARPRKDAFTLVELLVVVATIALLIAILIPSLRTARQQAKRIACQANLKHIAAGWHNRHYVDHTDDIDTSAYEATLPENSRWGKTKTWTEDKVHNAATWTEDTVDHAATWTEDKVDQAARGTQRAYNNAANSVAQAIAPKMYYYGGEDGFQT